MRKMQKIWQTLNTMHDVFLITLVALMILFAVYCVWDSAYLLSSASDSSLRNYKPGESDSVNNSPITEEQIGWLSIDGTGIDYPLMQGEDNYVFLNRDPYGHFSLSGSIFLDSRSNPDFSDDYSLIYGHHVEFGRMFGALDAFLDEDYLRAHSRGTLYLGRDGSRRLQLRIIAATRADARDKVYFDPFIGAEETRQMISRADVRVSEPTGRLIALTTCVDESTENRLLVFAQIIES